MTKPQIQYFEYQRKIHRTFQPVICDDIEYGLKYADRSLINTLFAQRGACEEIMIIKMEKWQIVPSVILIFRQGKNGTRQTRHCF